MAYEDNSGQSQPSEPSETFAITSGSSYMSYHNSVCGSILHSSPTNSPSEIFSYLYHGKFDAFHRCFDMYHKEIVQMRNERGQTILHIFTIYGYPYHWMRLILMRGCDPCCQDNDGYTAAHYAVERNEIEHLKALTARFFSRVKPIPEQQATAIHDACLKALTLRENHGLTPFMLCVNQESMKCLDYLLELNINDVNLHDNFGDTCLHYAVARRNEILVEKLINQCNANIYGGDNTRPSVLDVLQYHRERQKPFDRIKDDSIERLLLSHNALNRCQIRRIINKRKVTMDNEETALSNLACLTDDTLVNSQIETAKNHARLALSLEINGDINGAQEYYTSAMNSVSNDTLDWANYAFSVALIHIAREENQLALSLLKQALAIRKRFENDSDEIGKIQRAIDNIQKT